MTHHPIEENHFNWWLTTWTTNRRLHAIPGPQITQQQHRDSIDNNEPLDRFTVCGSRLRTLMVPGLFSRLGLRRCVPCCRRLGIPSGRGTPANDITGCFSSISVGGQAITAGFSVAAETPAP